ncbi:MAG TPA: phosphoribosylanthranilate isomerase [Terriglobales bacterium]|nr:phosphoribosylanthranilate isomerase [Terriglobales bacterium]
MTWVKICGTTNLHDAQLSIAAGADALGFIFAPSPRRVDVFQISEICARLPGGVEKIGVFVNETPRRVGEIVGQLPLSGVQLHGDEPAEQMKDFRKALGGRLIIKTLQAGEILSGGEEKLEKYLVASASLDAILLDSGSARERGGTGIPLAWEQVAPVAATIRDTLPLIIAGGLNAENVVQAMEWLDPWGVDVVSGVESEPGQKDQAKLRDFVAAVRGSAAGKA